MTRGIHTPGLNHALAVLLVACGLAAGAAGAGEATRVAVPAPAPTELQLRHAAAECERRGEPLRAAAYYERLLATNAAANAVVRARLVDLYAAAGRTNEALAHARVEMKSRPDPQAYYAAVLAGVGRNHEARALLRTERAAETNVVRRARLETQQAGRSEAGP